MSYTINHYNGTTLIPGGLSDGTYDQTYTSLTLIGRELPNYGQFLNENLVYLTENFAGTSSPSHPLVGQLWWDTADNVLKVYSGTSWKISTGATSSAYASPPGDLSTNGGDLWYDNTNSQLKVYSGTSWVTVGPVTTPATGDTGAFPAIMTDTSSGSHIVIQFKFSGVIYAVYAKESFASSLSGFANLVTGINFSSLYTQGLNTQSTSATNSTLVQRDVTGAIAANAIVGTSLAATTVTATTMTATTFNGNLAGNVSGTTVAATTVSASGVTASSGFSGTVLTASQPNITALGNVTNLKTNGTTNLVGYATYNGSELATSGGAATFSSINNTPVGNATPSTGAFTTLTTTTSLAPTANAVINLGSLSNWWGSTYSNAAVLNYLTVSASTTFNTLNIVNSIVPTSNVTVNLGSSSNWWNTIYGRAIQAQYADLAERFEADAEYAPGTVVEMGGTAEITKVVDELSEKVFGVISTNAAYLMNSAAGSDLTHPPIAMSGRVPVRVVGLIAKGDRLVSAGNGLARAGQHAELTPWNVIGRSLVDKTNSDEALIEAIVKINS